MSASISEIISVLNSISNIRTAKQLDKLAAAVERIASTDEPLPTVEPLLQIFERHPDSDGHVIFWSMLNTIEAIPGYESYLLSSIRRMPSNFSLLMINRMMNSGVIDVEGVNLFSLLADIETDTQYPKKIRKTAGYYLEYQRGKA